MKNNIFFKCPYCYVDMEFVAPGSIIVEEIFELWHCPCCSKNIVFYLRKNSSNNIEYTGKFEEC